MCAGTSSRRNFQGNFLAGNETHWTRLPGEIVKPGVSEFGGHELARSTGDVNFAAARLRGCDIVPFVHNGADCGPVRAAPLDKPKGERTALPPFPPIRH